MVRQEAVVVMYPVPGQCRMRSYGSVGDEGVAIVEGRMGEMFMPSSLSSVASRSTNGEGAGEVGEWPRATADES